MFGFLKISKIKEPLVQVFKEIQIGEYLEKRKPIMSEHYIFHGQKILCNKMASNYTTKICPIFYVIDKSIIYY
jgi:hypothetical protein